MPLLATENKKYITGTLMADIVLQLLSYAAKTECEFIPQRHREGSEATQAGDVKFGRPPMQSPGNYNDVVQRWYVNEISVRETSRRLGITHRTMLNWYREG